MFITFEGIEGSGKTTQAKLLAEKFKEVGKECVVTREPGGTEIGKKIRAILLDPASKNLEPYAELLLYVADRVQHVNTVIKPALDSGKFVLCDRFFDATLAYQGQARGLGTALVHRFHDLVHLDLQPDITFLLDLPVDVGLTRARKDLRNNNRSESESRFEEEDLKFHQAVKEAYLFQVRIAALSGEKRWIVIDVNKSEEKVAEQIWREIQRRFL